MLAEFETWQTSVKNFAKTQPTVLHKIRKGSGLWCVVVAAVICCCCHLLLLLCAISWHVSFQFRCGQSLSFFLPSFVHSRLSLNLFYFRPQTTTTIEMFLAITRNAFKRNDHLSKLEWSSFSLGSQMLMDPHLGQQQSGLQH